MSHFGLIESIIFKLCNIEGFYLAFFPLSKALFEFLAEFNGIWPSLAHIFTPEVKPWFWLLCLLLFSLKSSLLVVTPAGVSSEEDEGDWRGTSQLTEVLRGVTFSFEEGEEERLRGTSSLDDQTPSSKLSYIPISSAGQRGSGGRAPSNLDRKEQPSETSEERAG